MKLWSVSYWVLFWVFLLSTHGQLFLHRTYPDGVRPEWLLVTSVVLLPFNYVSTFLLLWVRFSSTGSVALQIRR